MSLKKTKTFPEVPPSDFSYILLARTGPVAVPYRGV